MDACDAPKIECSPLPYDFVPRYNHAINLKHMGSQSINESQSNSGFTDNKMVLRTENLVKKYAGYAAPLKKITPHKLRSTYATNLYRATEDIYVVADVLGHSDVNTTKRHYAQMSEENRRKAAKITKIADAKHFEEEN